MQQYSQTEIEKLFEAQFLKLDDKLLILKKEVSHNRKQHKEIKDNQSSQKLQTPEKQEAQPYLKLTINIVNYLKSNIIIKILNFLEDKDIANFKYVNNGWRKRFIPLYLQKKLNSIGYQQQTKFRSISQNTAVKEIQVKNMKKYTPPTNNEYNRFMRSWKYMYHFYEPIQFNKVSKVKLTQYKNSKKPNKDFLIGLTEQKQFEALIDNHLSIPESSLLNQNGYRTTEDLFQIFLNRDKKTKQNEVQSYDKKLKKEEEKQLKKEKKDNIILLFKKTLNCELIPLKKDITTKIINKIQQIYQFYSYLYYQSNSNSNIQGGLESTIYSIILSSLFCQSQFNNFQKKEDLQDMYNRTQEIINDTESKHLLNLQKFITKPVFFIKPSAFNFYNDFHKNILMHIFKYAYNPDEYKQMLQLRLVCQKWNSTVENLFTYHKNQQKRKVESIEQQIYEKNPNDSQRRGIRKIQNIQNGGQNILEQLSNVKNYAVVAKFDFIQDHVVDILWAIKLILNGGVEPQVNQILKNYMKSNYFTTSVFQSASRSFFSYNEKSQLNLNSNRIQSWKFLKEKIFSLKREDFKHILKPEILFKFQKYQEEQKIQKELEKQKKEIEKQEQLKNKDNKGIKASNQKKQNKSVQAQKSTKPKPLTVSKPNKAKSKKLTEQEFEEQKEQERIVQDQEIVKKEKKEFEEQMKYIQQYQMFESHEILIYIYDYIKLMFSIHTKAYNLDEMVVIKQLMKDKQQKKKMYQKYDRMLLIYYINQEQLKFYSDYLKETQVLNPYNPSVILCYKKSKKCQKQKRYYGNTQAQDLGLGNDDGDEQIMEQNQALQQFYSLYNEQFSSNQEEEEKQDIESEEDLKLYQQQEIPQIVQQQFVQLLDMQEQNKKMKKKIALEESDSEEY